MESYEIRGVSNEGLYEPQVFAWAIALASLPAAHITDFTAAAPFLVSALAAVAEQAGAVAAGWHVVESHTPSNRTI